MTTRTTLVSLLFVALASPLGCVVVSDDEGESAASESDSDTDGGSDSDPSGGSDSDPSGGSDSDPSGDSNSDTAGDGEVPMDGRWLYVGGTLDDQCGGFSAGYGWGDFTITSNGDGTFTADSTDETFDCDLLDGGDFHCPDRAADPPATEGFDAEITVSVEVEGTFDSPTSGNGEQIAEATCEGTDCELVATTFGVTFPCMVTEPFEITWVAG